MPAALLATDVTKPEAKSLQNDVLFDPDVRAAARGLVDVKLDRVKYEDAFAALGLETTPAIVLVDVDFNPLERLEGAITAKALLAALKKTAAPAAKPR